MPEKTAEEQANELLRDFAIACGVSLRQLGIIDERRQRTIDEREVPMTAAKDRSLRIVGWPTNDEDEESSE